MDEEILNDTTEHLLYDLRLVDETNHELKQAAVLLFHPDPERYISGAYIKIGFFRNDDEDLAFQDEVHGSLMEQIDKTMDLIKTKYLIYGITYEGISREETPQFPVEAIRESLMNAIAHKDYSDATPTQISIYSDHIVFWNAGRLPDDWTTQRLFEKHPSRPHNPAIANTMFRCGDIESWGRGYKRILQAVSSYNLLPPAVELLSGLMITYYTDIRSQLKAQKLDEKLIKIIEYTAKNGSVSNADIQQSLGVSKATTSRMLQQIITLLEKHGGERGRGTYYTIKGLE